jgi:hypothetical protein
MAWLGQLSLPVIGILLFILLVLAMEIGFRGPRLLERLFGEGGAGRPAAPDHLVSAMLGLLALLLGFTFSLALNRYEARRDLVVAEANAIGTTWLRAGLVEGPAREEMRGVLKRYVDARIAWSHDPAAVRHVDRTQALQQRLWTSMGTVMRTDRSPTFSKALMEAMNGSFDLASARFAARSVRLPGEVLWVLVLSAALSATMLGYMMASSDRRHRVATMLLLLLLSLSLTMILDLDRSTEGAIQVSQKPLETLRASMR